MSRRASLAILTLTLLTGLSSGPAGAGVADRIGATFALMAGDFIETFQPVEGLVVSVEGEDIFLDVSAGTGAKPGQEYTVFRKGDVFRHPLTGKVLGRYEEVLGFAQIRRVYPQFSVARFVPLPDRPAPRPADGGRITRGRIRIAITPVLDLTDSRADLRRVPFMLASALERSKRFQVVDPLAVLDQFASGAARVEEVLARPERAVRIATNLEVAGWLVPVLLDRNGVLYLDCTYISAVTGTALVSRRQPLAPAGAAEEQRFPWEPKAED